MLFRIQSLHLVLSTGVSLAAVLLILTEKPIFSLTEGVSFQILFSLSSLLSMYVFFVYKHRKRQFVINRFNILINLVIISLTLYRVFSDQLLKDQDFGVYAPIIIMILLSLANRNIKKDEDRICSADRIR